ncbi:MAG: translation initiation factor IF-3 [Sandaracinaceae bacterium]|nr:translation initiation factor IF-3 [Sandaracinaceae bacterium]MBP7681291.1 translation initiation factor IF-3 [Deltaproteobacteria bacterium]
MASRRFDPRDRQSPFGPRVNERIRVPEVRVIGPDGAMLGVLETHEARRIAREADLDLVEVNPKAVPPVCKIMDHGRFKYEEKKKQNEAKKKQAQVELKEIKLRPKTDEHDIAFKVKHARRFLEEGNKVKITVRFRGREITHPETAQRQIDAMVEAVGDVAIVELYPRMEARTMTAMLAPRVKPKPRAVREGGGGREAAVERADSSSTDDEYVDDENYDDDDEDDDDDMDDADRAAAAEKLADKT